MFRHSVHRADFPTRKIFVFSTLTLFTAGLSFSLRASISGTLETQYLVSSDPEVAAGDPVPVPAPELGEGPHLSYAVQWFIFAVCVAVGWVFAVRRSIGAGTRSRACSFKNEHPFSTISFSIDIPLRSSAPMANRIWLVAKVPRTSAVESESSLFSSPLEFSRFSVVAESGATDSATFQPPDSC